MGRCRHRRRGLSPSISTHPRTTWNAATTSLRRRPAEPTTTASLSRPILDTRGGTCGARGPMCNTEGHRGQRRGGQARGGRREGAEAPGPHEGAAGATVERRGRTQGEEEVGGQGGWPPSRPCGEGRWGCVAAEDEETGRTEEEWRMGGAKGRGRRGENQRRKRRAEGSRLVSRKERKAEGERKKKEVMA